MKRFVFFMVLAALMAGCNGRKDRADGRFMRESVERIVSIDEISEVEDIVADSSLMNASGDRAWKPVNDKLTRVKVGDKCYLRMETKEGNITSLTYRYDD